MKKLKPILQHNFIYYVVLFIAICFYFVSSNTNYISYYDSFDGENFVITGITFYDYGIKYDLKGKEKAIGYIYCDKPSIKKYKATYLLGDHVKIIGTIKKINNNTVPNTFNYKKYLTDNKIYNVIIINDIKKVKTNRNIIYRLKTMLLNRSFKLKKSYPYINGLIFGVNSYIDDDVMESYRENGISHLFAISGLHISIFTLIIAKCLKKVPLNDLIIIMFLIFYMFLTNYAMSVERCVIFTILLMINRLLKFEISSINLLLLTLSIILFNNPLSINNIGLQYSFLVTFSLIKYQALITGNGVVKLFKISAIAFLVSYPITVNNFYQINLLSLVCNLFFVPYVSFILLPMTLIAYFFPIFDTILFLLIKVIEYCSSLLNSISVFKIIFCKMSPLVVFVYYVIVFFFLSIKKYRRYLMIILLVFMFLHYVNSFKEQDYVLFFDVNQGDSAIINVNNNISLIDTGGIVSYNSNEYNYPISKNKIIPYLKSKGIRRIDNLILSHGDFDHMGEAKHLVNNFKVEKVIFNCGTYNDLEKELIKVLDKKKIKYYSCIKELNIDKNKLYFLQTKIYDNENDNSNVIYTEFDSYKFMFMGDASSTTEHEILSKYNLSDIDVLKVGHHGSRTSSSKKFIDEINPKYSIISVGKNNRYGHPNKEVIENLKGSKVYRTDEDGSIMLKIKNNRLKIETCTP